MPQLEAWEKVWISQDFMSSTHGSQNCTSCHGGSNTPQKMDDAHKDVVRDPAADAVAKCDPCHAGYGAQHEQSLHGTLNGYKELIKLRTGQTTLSPELEEMYTQNCASCHTTCGQCHISRPQSVGGGFNNGHIFTKRPSMTLNCTACHGSRIGEEFRGEHSGLSADVHYNQGMQCVACHSSQEIHTSNPTAKHRYDETDQTTCKTCHEIGSSNTYHTLHNEKVDCQVCHSQPYKNCYSCHVGKSSAGLQQPSELDFKIGKNHLKSAARPHNYVLLRHIPIAPDSYEEWAPGQMTNFSVKPTWKYTTPHNIQKNTPQTANCTSSCHNNPSLFLKREDMQHLSQQEQIANESVVVDDIP